MQHLKLCWSSPAGNGEKRMAIADVVRESWLYIGTLEWDPHRCNPKWVDTQQRDVPKDVGVYIWLDESGRVQKVGKAEGREGLRQRYSWGTGDPERDSTTRLWRDVWGSGALRGKRIKVYFDPCPPLSMMKEVRGFGRIEVLAQTAREEERTLSIWARNDGEPMLLAGKAD